MPADIPPSTQTLTYRELGDAVVRVAEGLRMLGVGHGDRVALVLPNNPEHVIAFHAVMRLGAIAVEHNPLYTERELRHQFEDHGATVAIVWDKVAPTLLDFPADVGVANVISVDITRGMPRSEMLKSRPLGLTVAKPALDDIAVLQYTSGTTGSSKGAILTHLNLRANASQGQAWVQGIVLGREEHRGAAGPVPKVRPGVGARGNAHPCHLPSGGSANL